MASADAVVLTTRRPHAEPVAMLFAARDEGGRRFPAAGLPERRLRGLDPAAASQVLGAPLGTDAPPGIVLSNLDASGRPLIDRPSTTCQP